MAMTRVMHCLHTLMLLIGMLLTLLGDGMRFLLLCLRQSPALAVENLFPRWRSALYQERQIKPRGATHATRLGFIWLDRWFDWRQALALVRPATLIRWHRQGFRMFWRRKSRPGRPCIPAELQALIRQMAHENPSSGQERIANELLLKLGLRVSPRTVRKYLPPRLNNGRGQRATSQCWRTFVCNHAQAMVACDFCVVVTSTFRLLYVFVVMEPLTRRILHVNVTMHTTASWTMQQVRDAMPVHHGYRFLIHDRNHIFCQQLYQCIRHLGLEVLKIPVRNPQANALSERLVGPLRRACLDFVIPLTEHHLHQILHAWVVHYNTGRPRMALGPSIPQPLFPSPVPLQTHRHQLPTPIYVVVYPILGGLHHEYRLEEQVA